SLRLTELAAKPPWTDEFSTIVFSLGNSFLPVPLDRAIALDVLLQPMYPNPNAGISDVLQHLSETNHPPLYFVLAHLWMRMFPPGVSGLASVWAERSLSVLFGVISIPAIYGLSWLAFRSRIVSQLTAAIIAVSPYGIFIAQEARHYTLAILWVIASLSCLTLATQHIQRRIPIPLWLILTWIGVNFIGVSTHYFFVLTLATEALWLIVLAWREWRSGGVGEWGKRISIVAIGTLAGCMVWLPLFIQRNHGGELTQWIQSGRGLLDWIGPIFQFLAVGLTMLYLLPVSVESIAVVAISALAMLVFLIWVLPILKRGFTTQLHMPNTGLMTQMFAVVIIGAIGSFFFFTYILRIDITRGARYYFVFFPTVIILLGVSLAVAWKQDDKEPKRWGVTGKQAVAIVWLMGLISALGVVTNLGYPKYYRPDLLVPVIQQVSHVPVLIATTHKTHVQNGEMMGLAREFKLTNSPTNPLFLLAHQEKNPKTSTIALQNTLTKLPRPLDLWLTNFHAPVVLNDCTRDRRPFPTVYGYDYQLYHCDGK
nr:glycosyltransferase [Nostocaceae cyanobacterium]